MKLYTRTVCPKCLWIKSEIARTGLPVEIVNVDQDEEARGKLLEAGIRSVPALEADGIWLVDPDDMMKLLEQRTA